MEYDTSGYISQRSIEVLERKGAGGRDRDMYLHICQCSSQFCTSEQEISIRSLGQTEKQTNSYSPSYTERLFNVNTEPLFKYIYERFGSVIFNKRKEQIYMPSLMS